MPKKNLENFSGPKSQRLNYNLDALKIAAGVFAQISNAVPENPHYPKGDLKPIPRTLSDFRESVDAVFKAAGLEKVDWKG